jgi:hypothetical protein
MDSSHGEPTPSIFVEEFAKRYQALLTQQLRRDPKLVQFGARSHGYRAHHALTDLPAFALPADYAAFLQTVSGGGAGPYYGLLSPRDWTTATVASAQQPSSLPDGEDEAAVTAMVGHADPWRGSVPLADVGCGYTALLVINGPATGQVWLDARAVGLVAPIARNFHDWIIDWLARLERNDLQLGYVPADACALPNAIAGFLAMWEQQHGVAPGELNATQVQQALQSLPANSIALAAQIATPMRDVNATVGPCIVCQQLIERLSLSGLAGDCVVRTK